HDVDQVVASSRHRRRREARDHDQRVRRTAGCPAPDPVARAGERGPAPSGGVPVAGEPAGKRLYPLVKELAAEGVAVAVTCRVLKLARQPYYRWLTAPISDSELTEAYRANALFDAHRADPEFGYRFLAEEAAEAGESMTGRTAWRICSVNRWWSVFGKPRRGKSAKVGPPVHDDLVNRNFTADRPNVLWLSDISEHRTTWIPVVVATLLEG